MPNPFQKIQNDTDAADTQTPSGRVDSSAAKRGAVDPRLARANAVLQKAPSSFESITDYAGEVLAVFPEEFKEEAFKGSNGEMCPGVYVDALVCTGPEAGKELKNTLVTGSILVGSLKRMIGQAVVMKIGQRPSEKKGFNPAWISIDTTPEEDAIASQMLAKVYGGGS